MLLRKHRGFILIFILWVLAFLTILAVGVAAGIRQKIVLLEKLEQRSRINYLLEATVKYATSYISNELSLAGQAYTIAFKSNLHNNAQVFGQFNLGGDNSSISYTLPDQGERFGVMDEERKININVTNATILARLIEKVLAEKSDVARELAENILDWRQFGESRTVGFFSKEYYSNLEYPYPKKDSSYETIDELLLVKGMTKERYEKFINYITIYGMGQVNINTASAEVLYALGLEDSLIEKILEVRQGKDRVEASEDDHVFLKTFDVAIEVNASIKLLPTEILAIDGLNRQNLLTTSSYYFSIKPQAHLARKFFSKSVYVIISSRENKIVYWKER